jgi:dCMP deaminase
MKRDQRWWDEWFLKLAAHVATASKDSTQTGAVIAAYDHRILGMGYNGFPRGMDDDLETLSRDERLARMIHAEVNALLFAGRLPESVTLYTHPLPPCDRCTAQMIQAGLRRFVAPHPSNRHYFAWRIDRSMQFIKEVGGEFITL